MESSTAAVKTEDEQPRGEVSPNLAAALTYYAALLAENEGVETLPPAGLVDSDEHTGIHAHCAGMTDVGLVRVHNEDSFIVADLSVAEQPASGAARRIRVGPHGLLLAVCDGMGGAAAGEVASQMAVQRICENMRLADPASSRDAFVARMVQAIEEAGRQIFDAARIDRSRRGMGTTATVASLINSTLFVGQVGDSRAYLLRRRQLVQLTRDQSLVNQLLEAGQITEEEAEVFEHSNIILQALGTAETVNVVVSTLELLRGDRLLLCSDGLCGLVTAEAIAEALATVHDIEACCRRLIELAQVAGGHDNITAIVVDFSGQGLAPVPVTGQPVSYSVYEGPQIEEEVLFEDTTTRRSTLAPADAPKTETGVASEMVSRRADTFRVPRRRKSGIGWVLASLGLLAAGGGWMWRVNALANAHARTQRAMAKRRAQAAEPHAAVVQPSAASAAEHSVKVMVKANMDGHLYVDGNYHGRLDPGHSTSLDLRPGVYLLEGRRGGVVIATSLLTVRPGVSSEVSLVTMQK